MDCFEEDSYTVNIVLGLGLLAVAGVAALFYLPPSAFAAFLVFVILFVLYRHRTLKRARGETLGRIFMASQGRRTAKTSHLPAVYFLYILGSGGHTTEMCEMIRRKLDGQKNTHRRYLTTTGDTHSPLGIAVLETLIKDAYIDGEAGTWDHFRVKRARAVHQPFYTAWFTTLWCALGIVNALSREPNERPRKKYGNSFKYPHVVITNGPGTGFIVCAVAYLLKIFYLVPQNRLKLVYVESWAHTQTLSLTGKLFHWTGIADLFCVQHRDLAEKLGKHYVGLVTSRVYPLG